MYARKNGKMMTESVEQFMEVARQLENEEATLSHSRDDREGSRESDRDDRERIRKGSSYERERKESNRYAPYSTSKTDRDRAKKRDSRKENRVYVSNLPFSLKWQDLKDHMKKGMLLYRAFHFKNCSLVSSLYCGYVSPSTTLSGEDYSCFLFRGAFFSR